MAKGQRSNRQKALRTVRREKVTATWQEEADRKRMEALRACVTAAPVALSEAELARMAQAKAEREARDAAERMDTGDGAGGAGARRGKKTARRGGKRGVKVGGGSGARKGGRRKQVGVLSKVSGEC